MITDINSEDRLVQKTFAEHLQDVLGWESIYAFNDETFGPAGTLGRASEREVILVRDLRAALKRLNPALPESAREQAIEKLTRVDFARSLIQHNREFYDFIRNGVPVEWRDAGGETKYARAQVIDFQNRIGADGTPNNRFLAVRELKIQGLRVPHYNRRADLVCFVNGLPLVFIELKAVYLNMRAGFDNNLTDYLSETSINHAFHHNAFLVVSNGDRARYGSITSKWEHFTEWKRNDEKEKGRVEAQVLLDGMLAKDRLLGLVENFVLFDDSKPGGTRKVVARNHQVLGVNNAVASMQRQEDLKREIPPDRRLKYRVVEMEPPAQAPPLPSDGRGIKGEGAPLSTINHEQSTPATKLAIIERAHPDLGRLGVFWHTQGSGKSYSMVMFAEKVRRHIPGNFTFVIATDREDLDDQIFRTFVGCGIADEKTPRARSGKELKELLKQNHRFIFCLIHKFNQDVNPDEPYSTRDDIIVISDEAHRTQAGKFARNMRLALPNASFLGFTGTPLFKYDHLTKRIFGGYVSRYDFKRSEEDNSTVKLVYENRGEKLGIARLDLNDRIAEAIARAELDPDKEALLEKLLGQDYEVITAGDRLDKLAADFGGGDGVGVVTPIEDYLAAFLQALEAAENHLKKLGFDPARLLGAKGFQRTEALRDAVDALYTSDDAKRRFEIMAREVFSRFKALLMEPSALRYAVRHDDIETIYKKLQERRDTADVTEVLKELQEIVSAAIRAQQPGDDQMDSKLFDMSRIDFAKLRDEFAKKVKRKAAALQDIRDVVEKKLAQMLAQNPQRMDFYKKYQDIIADYNREKDRVTIEETFGRLVDFAAGLDAAQKQAAEEGLSQDEYALFQMLFKETISKADRERLKLASRDLLAALIAHLRPMPNWTKNTQTQADVKMFILDNLYASLPRPPFSEEDTESLAGRVYNFVWQRTTAGAMFSAAA